MHRTSTHKKKKIETTSSPDHRRINSTIRFSGGFSISETLRKLWFTVLVSARIFTIFGHVTQGRRLLYRPLSRLTKSGQWFASSELFFRQKIILFLSDWLAELLNMNMFTFILVRNNIAAIVSNGVVTKTITINSWQPYPSHAQSNKTNIRCDIFKHSDMPITCVNQNMSRCLSLVTEFFFDCWLTKRFNRRRQSPIEIFISKKKRPMGHPT